jgi:hypothetical protein
MRSARFVAIVACATALMAGEAQASTITIGSVLPPGSTPTEFGQVQTLFNSALPEKGVNLTSPVDGAIVRWRVQGASGGPFILRVLRPNNSGGYQASGTSNPATPTSPDLQTFAANLKVEAGDLVGVDPTNAADKIGVAEVAGANYGFIFPPPFDGATVAPSGSVAGKEIELSAEVQPAPQITEVAPNHGTVKGGTKVTITGTDLASASAVKFGETPATSYQVESETKITAVAPANKKVQTVDITVATLAGTNKLGRPDRFTYEGCVVPKLKGKTLKAAKKQLRNAHCKLGKVSEKPGKAGKVIKQKPKPKKVLKPGSKVSVTLGKKK